MEVGAVSFGVGPLGSGSTGLFVAGSVGGVAVRFLMAIPLRVGAFYRGEAESGREHAS